MDRGQKEPYRSIRATYTADTITVYQAYPASIATAAVKAGKFVPPFKLGRMTWIKPSFLWMAYRCGWATKPNQEHVLAIEITREGFEWALSNSLLSHFDKSIHADEKEYEEQKKKNCPVRVQWDPERDFEFRPLGYRSLQVGLSGEAVRRYVDDWTVKITDVTDRMREVGSLVAERRFDEARRLLPEERTYPLPDDVGRVVGASAVKC